MNDLIYRQTAIDAIDEISREVDDGYGFDYAKWRQYFCELPSEHGTNLAEVGTDCISRQAAIDALYHVDEYNGRSVEAIRNLPSVQPMQKEAKWMTAYLDHESMGRRPKILYCSRCNRCVAYPTDFCPACGADMRRLI